MDPIAPIQRSISKTYKEPPYYKMTKKVPILIPDTVTPLDAEIATYDLTDFITKVQNYRLYHFL
jgi:hypothetical protein